MKNNSLIFSLFILLFSMACSKHERHSASYYNKLGSDNADKDGFHHNEAQRVLDFKEQNKAAHEAETEEFKGELKENLNSLNKPNRYNSKPLKAKRKRYNFYM